MVVDSDGFFYVVADQVVVEKNKGFFKSPILFYGEKLLGVSGKIKTFGGLRLVVWAFETLKVFPIP